MASTMTIGQRIERFRRDHFVGRAFELQLFAELLEGIDDRSERIVNVHGMAGIGKTYLLDRYSWLAAESGAAVVRANAAEALHAKERLCRLLEESAIAAAGGTFAADAEVDANAEADAGAVGRCLRALNGLAESRPLVLLLDGYEEMGALDHWFRTSFVPALGGRTLLVVAGRYPLAGPWKYEPAWNRLVIRLPLAELSYDDIREYAAAGGLTDEEAIDSLWLRTLGHPLSMSLLAASHETAGTANAANAAREANEPFETLLDAWLREADDEPLARLLHAAASVRTFHQELLAALTGEDVPSALFRRLTALSFVARTSGGWQLHELVREALRRSFRERMPETFERYAAAAVSFYEKTIIAKLAAGADCSAELAELLRYAGNAVMRAHFRHAKPSGRYIEPVDGRNLAEADDYVRRRVEEARERRIRCSDPETGASFRYTLSASEQLQRLPLVPLDALLRMDPQAIKLIRDGDGRVDGLIAAVTIRSSNMAELKRTPGARAFFSRMDARRPADCEGGVFLFTTDVANLEDEEQRAEIVRVVFDYVLEGRLIVVSPPPQVYFDDAYTSLGFARADHADHDDYGLGTVAHTYVLDTRREKLERYLQAMVPGFRGTAARATAELPPLRLDGLTEREREVAALLTTGLTNAQIAAALYVSEAAVKKHVNAMLGKFGATNRTQLANQLLAGADRS